MLSAEDRILEELAKLELSRRRLKHFISYTFPGFHDARHQDLIIEKLEQVEKFIATEGKEGIGRLIINIPPRHGKTFLCSEMFPAWVFGRNPDKKVILTSYGATLAESASFRVRNLMETSEYQKIFGKGKSLLPGETIVEVDSERRSVQTWDIKGHQGRCVAAGVGGPIIGQGAHLMVIDDPHKDREEAESEKMRENVWDWFTSVAYTRLQKGAAVVIIMQRWHEDDLVGRLLSRQPEKWETVVLPAIADSGDMLKRQEGEALWPEEYSIAKLIDIKSIQPPRDWNSMYQQQPSGADGDVFKADWFVYADTPQQEEITQGIQVWDCAMTEREEGDYSACVTLYVTRSGVFVADVFRARLNFPDLKATMFRLYSHWHRFFPISRICIENRVAGMSMMQALKKDSHLPIIPLEPDSKLGKSKLQRANSVSGYVQAGRVTFRKGGTWIHEFEDEMLKFPRGKHDDMVDAFVYGLIQLNGGGRPPRKSLETYRNMLTFGKGVDRHGSLLGGW